MASARRLDLFFGLVTLHGLLELTAVFIAGAGPLLGWTVIDPGPRPRAEAGAAQGRATAGMALGLAIVLLISGAIEAFVTPSGLPTAARIGIGALDEALSWPASGCSGAGRYAPARSATSRSRRGRSAPSAG